MENKIKKVMASVFGIKELQINKNTSPETLEEWDSLSHMNLIVALEEEFNFKFNNEEIIEMLSYPLIKILIEGKIKKNQGKKDK